MRDMPQRSLGAWIAGIRETFEEAGILLAYDRSGSPVALREADEIARFHNYRRLLYGNSITLKTILEREELALATDSIYYYSHWITPESSPIRYDVRFFVAPVPSHQAALHDGHELIDHVWVTPQEALLANRAGNFRMVLPTIMTLKELCCFGSVEEVIRSTRDKKIPAILTTLIRKGDRLVEIMPDGTDFGPSPVADQEEG
jgi:8-oxo-dGTP pyrophosphatase MutT (NUDIX family)